MRLLGVETAFICRVVSSLFPKTDTKFQVKHRMKGEWVQAEDLYMIIIFFLENIVKNTLETLEIWQKIPWKTLEKNLISLLVTLSEDIHL